jgi:hypothetical protein
MKNRQTTQTNFCHRFVKQEFADNFEIPEQLNVF